MLTKEAFIRKYPQFNENQLKAGYHLTQVCCPLEVLKTSYRAFSGNTEAFTGDEVAAAGFILSKLDENGNYLPKF